MAPTLDLPHLTDTEKVRAEAAAQYGGLDNAAVFIQAHKASRDPNVEAAQLKPINGEATEKVMEDLEENGLDSEAQKLIDEAYGEGKFVVLSAAVRQHALVAVGESTADGRTYKLVAGYTKKWSPIVETPAQRSERVGAETAAAKGRLGAEARIEVEKMLDKALDKALDKVGEMLANANIDVDKARSEALAAGMEAADEDEGDESDESDDGSDEGDDGTKSEWPRRKDDLKKIAAKHKDKKADLKNSDTVDEMIGKLEAAGIKPPTAE